MSSDDQAVIASVLIPFLTLLLSSHFNVSCVHKIYHYTFNLMIILKSCSSHF